jgi:hypothetical protein
MKQRQIAPPIFLIKNMLIVISYPSGWDSIVSRCQGAEALSLPSGRLMAPGPPGDNQVNQGGLNLHPVTINDMHAIA